MNEPFSENVNLIQSQGNIVQANQFIGLIEKKITIFGNLEMLQFPDETIRSETKHLCGKLGLHYEELKTIGSDQLCRIKVAE